jgi:hypothetical protein
MHPSLLLISKAAAKWRKIDRAIKPVRHFLPKPKYDDGVGEFRGRYSIGRSEFFVRMNHEIRKGCGIVRTTAIVLFKNDTAIVGSYFVEYLPAEDAWEISAYFGTKNDMDSEFISPEERALAKQIARKLGFLAKKRVVPERLALQKISDLITVVSKAEADAAEDKRHRARLAKLGIAI